jgi:hypothetical protein
MVSYPITFNEPKLYEKMLPTLKRVNGESNVHYMDAITGGHTANLSFWFDDDDGKFVTSNYYVNELPKWVEKFNSKIVKIVATSKNPLILRFEYDLVETPSVCKP